MIGSTLLSRIFLLFFFHVVRAATWYTVKTVDLESVFTNISHFEPGFNAVREQFGSPRAPDGSW